MAAGIHGARRDGRPENTRNRKDGSWPSRRWLQRKDTKIHREGLQSFSRPLQTPPHPSRPPTPPLVTPAPPITTSRTSTPTGRAPPLSRPTTKPRGLPILPAFQTPTRHPANHGPDPRDGMRCALFTLPPCLASSRLGVPCAAPTSTRAPTDVRHDTPGLLCGPEGPFCTHYPG